MCCVSPRTAPAVCRVTTRAVLFVYRSRSPVPLEKREPSTPASRPRYHSGFPNPAHVCLGDPPYPPNTPSRVGRGCAALEPQRVVSFSWVQVAEKAPVMWVSCRSGTVGRAGSPSAPGGGWRPEKLAEGGSSSGTHLSVPALWFQLPGLEPWPPALSTPVSGKTNLCCSLFLRLNNNVY